MEVKKIRKICILVKAYPQPSQQYGQTVCCAGITSDGEFLRLYPIPYMDLQPDQKFKRYDWIEAEIWSSGGRDHRPESHKVLPESIRIVTSADNGKKSREKIWLPFVNKSFAELKKKNLDVGASLGIIRPDVESLRFKLKNINSSSDDDIAVVKNMYAQQALFSEGQQVKIPKPTKSFHYSFSSGDSKHDMTIHDWEVQAAHYKFTRSYGKEAENKFREMYQEILPRQNLHFIMGTQLSRPHQFMIIGMLRYTLADEMDNQGSLF